VINVKTTVFWGVKVCSFVHSFVTRNVLQQSSGRNTNINFIWEISGFISGVD